MLRPILTGLAVMAAVGCGGISGTHTISPATFLLPGLGQVNPPVSTNAPITVAVVE